METHITVADINAAANEWDLDNHFQEDPNTLDFVDYLEEHGFGGQIYASFPEFMDAEYQDEEYMKDILSAKEFDRYQKDRFEPFADDIYLLWHLKDEDESVMYYGLTSDTRKFFCIAPNESDDIGAALENTLHRLLDAGYDKDDIYRIMGAYIPDPEEYPSLEEFHEYVDIDLGYILPGMIICYMQEE
jgi:hypothetical protein